MFPFSSVSVLTRSGDSFLVLTRFRFRSHSLFFQVRFRSRPFPVSLVQTDSFSFSLILVRFRKPFPPFSLDQSGSFPVREVGTRFCSHSFRFVPVLDRFRSHSFSAVITRYCSSLVLVWFSSILVLTHSRPFPFSLDQSGAFPASEVGTRFCCHSFSLVPVLTCMFRLVPVLTRSGSFPLLYETDCTVFT